VDSTGIMITNRGLQ
jgi:hypothetical protein